MFPPMRLVGLAIVLAACGGDRRAGDPWADRPLVRTTGTVGDARAGTLPFAVELPRGLSLAKTAPSGLTIVYTASGDATAPSVSIAFNAIPPRSLDDAVRAASTGLGEIAAREVIAGGYLVAAHAAGYWSVEVFRIAGDHGVDCMAQQARDDARELLEKICRSLAIPSS
jgi:hypothetical protein